VNVTSTQPDHPPPPGDASDSSPAVRTWGLSLQLDDRSVLDNINLNIPAGRTVALLGANGAGKSTLLRVLAALMPASKGELFLFGRKVDPAATKMRSQIGVIAHQPMLYRDLSARENLELFGGLYEVSDPGARASDLLKLVGLPRRADEPIKKLSRGMTQRLAIARALMHDPRLLLADEPFDGLDAPSGRMLQALLGRLGAGGKTVIFSNHNIPQSLELADRAVVLRYGRVVLDQPTGELDVHTLTREISAT